MLATFTTEVSAGHLVIVSDYCVLQQRVVKVSLLSMYQSVISPAREQPRDAWDWLEDVAGNHGWVILLLLGQELQHIDNRWVSARQLSEAVRMLSCHWQANHLTTYD